MLRKMYLKMAYRALLKHKQITKFVEGSENQIESPLKVIQFILKCK